jgi:hypothetical protein
MTGLMPLGEPATAWRSPVRDLLVSVKAVPPSVVISSVES